MKHYLIFILLLACGFSSCKKKDIASYDGNQFTLSIDDTRLKWSKVNSEDFVRYDVFRSSEPIVNPALGQAVNATRIFTSNNRETTSVADSINFTSGNSYYKVFAVLKSRQISSNEVTWKNSIRFINGFASAIIPFEEEHLICMQVTSQFGGSSLVMYDYQNDTVVKTINGSVGLSTTNCVFVNNNGNTQIFQSVGGNAFNILDANTLAIVSSVPLPNGSQTSGTIAYANGKIYIGRYSPAGILVYDVNTGTFQSEALLGTSSFGSPKISISKDKKKLYYVEQNQLLQEYNILAGGNLSLENMVGITSNFGLQNNLFTPSINGDLMVTDPNGSVINNALDFVGTIPKLDANSNFVSYLFSDDNKYIFSLMSSNFGSSSIIQVNKQSDLSFVKSLSSGVANTFSSTGFMFIDEGKLFSISNANDPLTGQNVTAIKQAKIDF